MTIGAIFIFLEVSTPFVCARWLFFHHGLKGSIVQNINTMFLFVTFIFGRVLVQAYLVYYYAIDWVSMMLAKEDVSLVYKAVLVEMSICVLLNVGLNFWWSYLILKQVYRVIFKGPEAD